MFRPLLAVSGFLCLLAAPACAEDAQPSFDCAKASTTLEHAICSDATLAKLDRDLAVIYAEALVQASDAEALRIAQRDWADERAAACGIMPGADDDVADVSNAGLDCLAELYTARLAQLAEPAPSLAAADPARRLTGLWQLGEVIEAADPAMKNTGQAGRLIHLDRHALSALDGAGCAGPTLRPLAEARARALDAEEQALITKADAASPDSRDGIASFCLGRLFALYLPAADGSLLVADAHALYRLQRLAGSNP